MLCQIDRYFINVNIIPLDSNLQVQKISKFILNLRINYTATRS